ncbi:hypothetical protein [Tuberibacillus sp. Marseille-P3662]|uniref:hypothetical protein n=1 Tax=Tuberibacillus sp. Marseille-P3662 TaxID=1965358 RepID=UPI00111C4A0C|nr:hypothetical protein [Tuberibacillus sp. Marseille-P3662]
MIKENLTGKTKDICFRSLRRKDLQDLRVAKKNGWLFDWRKAFIEAFNVYGIFVIGDPQVQGLIALAPNAQNQLVDVDLIEAAPQNKWKHHSQVYAGIGKTLIAFAAFLSFKQSYEGYIGLAIKTNYNEEYYTSLGAVRARGGIPPYYFFPTSASYELVETYLSGGVRWC